MRFAATWSMGDSGGGGGRERVGCTPSTRAYAVPEAEARAWEGARGRACACVGSAGDEQLAGVGQDQRALSF